MRLGSLVYVLCGHLLLATGCLTPTQTAIVMDADPALRDALIGGTLMLRVTNTNGERRENLASAIDENFLWPIVQPFHPRTGDATSRFLMEAEVRDSEGQIRAALRVIGGFEEHRLMEIVVPFEEACREAFSSCAPRETCHAGRCVEACFVLRPFHSPGSRSSTASCGDYCTAMPDGSSCGAPSTPGRCWSGRCCHACFEDRTMQLSGAEPHCLSPEELERESCGGEGARCETCCGDESCDAGMCSVSGDPIRLAAGERHNCSVSTSGCVACWGESACGQSGVLAPAAASCPSNGTSLITPPHQISGLGPGFIGAGRDHTCWCSDDAARCVCWGWDGQRRLGFAPTGAAIVPETVIANGDEVAVEASSPIAAGLQHTCITTPRGVGAQCWGATDNGQLGLDFRVVGGSVPPTPIEAPADGGRWSRLVAGRFHMCGLSTNGEVYCWGASAGNATGFRGGRTVTIEDKILQVHVMAPELVGQAVDVATSDQGSCMLVDSDPGRAGAEDVWCWGRLLQTASLVTTDGRVLTELHLPHRLRHPGPFLVPDALGRPTLAVGDSHVCAILQDETTVVCAGRDDTGELGRPAAIAGVSSASHGVLAPIDAPGHGFVSVVAGLDHTCAVRDDETVWCWGRGVEGQLDSVGSTSSARPTRVCVETQGCSL